LYIYEATISISDDNSLFYTLRRFEGVKFDGSSVCIYVFIYRIPFVYHSVYMIKRLLLPEPPRIVSRNKITFTEIQCTLI